MGFLSSCIKVLSASALRKYVPETSKTSLFFEGESVSELEKGLVCRPLEYLIASASPNSVKPQISLTLTLLAGSLLSIILMSRPVP